VKSFGEIYNKCVANNNKLSLSEIKDLTARIQEIVEGELFLAAITSIMTGNTFSHTDQRLLLVYLL
jgi:hypothetical protein